MSQFGWTVGGFLMLPMCFVMTDQTGESAVPRPGGKPVDLPGLHNVIYVFEKLYSGGVPENDTGFESLKRLGIKTIISVDGARPDIERAKRFDMRYVHLPIGYDGVGQEQALQLARAVRDLPGPIYLHCHHGKHRSAGAAAAVQMCLDDKCTAAQAVNIMKRAGTDPRYVGLFDAPNRLKRPTRQALDAVKADFSEHAEIPALAKLMVNIDEQWDHIALIRKADWKTPKQHPDLDPPHEALMLWEHFRETGRLRDTPTRPTEFKALLTVAENAAQELEEALRQFAIDAAEPVAIERAFQRSRSACTQCHAKFRDVPQKP
jgi:protein tyrosine phosphatase (PTP) superfamily phosphohydrolase (DUF442 family)